jgi:mono/diheme cytochrome c family protein
VTLSLRFIMISMVLCCVVSCSQNDEPQANAQSVSQATSVDRESAGEPSSLVESHDESPQFNSNDSSLAIFEKRILPIFQSAKPSSCAECHLSGVDLKEYIRPTQQQTFASLVSAGLIDVTKPDESKILTFISRRPEKPGLVTDEIRQVEFEAFRAWVRAAVSDSTLIADKDVQPVGPQLSEEVIRHARKDRVLASFVENVWTEVGRCAACHSPDQNQKQVKEHGAQVSWITLRDPQATLNYLLEADLIDADEPEKSLLLMKPTMQIKHGGGQKMVIGDRSYKQFRRFIDDYTAVVQDKYATSEQLPEQSNEVSVVTDIWFKIEGVPAQYDKMLLQVDLYPQTDSGWSEHRVATSDRPVFGGGNLWQHSLSLTAQRGTNWATQIAAAKLPSGKYLAKLYIDQTGKLQKDFTAELNEQDLVGEVELESQWPAGYGNMTIVKFPAE